MLKKKPPSVKNSSSKKNTPTVEKPLRTKNTLAAWRNTPITLEEALNEKDPLFPEVEYKVKKLTT